ncbi:MAG: peroxidase-related enzyme [Alphaproteobacteria bacterium]|nr:peroxidase-related enzyme [Alphaproteobacteria bacterium]
MTDEPIHALSIADRGNLDERRQRFLEICVQKLGFLPNVLKAYAFDNAKLSGFTDLYGDLMLGDSGLSKLEREMIAVTVSSINHCFYCLSAHGQSVRQLSGDPILGETLVANYRAARLNPRQRAMLDFAAKLTETPDKMVEADRQALREAGLSDAEIWDVAATAAFFNMSNRMASAIDMRPNREYHFLDREDPAKRAKPAKAAE